MDYFKQRKAEILGQRKRRLRSGWWEREVTAKKRKQLAEARSLIDAEKLRLKAAANRLEAFWRGV